MPANKKPLIEDYFLKLNKRADRLNLPHIVWSWGTAFINNNGNGSVLLCPLEIVGPLSVSYENWEFAATVHCLPTGENIFRALINSNDIPIEYRSSGTTCEHCKVNRYRKEAFILYNKETKTYIQVGSSCIKDFLGYHRPEDIINKANLVSQLYTFLDGVSGDYSSDGIVYFHHIKNWLAHTSACIRNYGWISKSKAYETGEVATAHRVFQSINQALSDSKFEVKNQDFDLADEALEWLECLSEQDITNSDYLYSIRAIARTGMVEKRTEGFASSIIQAYQKAQADNKKNISNFVGTVNKRENFLLTLKNYFTFNGSYGLTHKFVFDDDIGNVLVWFASKPQDLSIGEKYLICGTVKQHSEYKGVKQTLISRCEVIELRVN